MPNYPRAIAATLPDSNLWTWFSSGFGPGQSGGFGQQPGFGTGGGVNPYANPPSVGAPPPKKSNAWIWILGIIGVGGLALMICCGAFGFWAYSAGVDMMGNMLKDEVAGHPVIQEHLGEISGNPSMNLMESTQETEKRGTGDNILVFEVKGTNGKEGELVVQQSKQPQAGQVFEKIDLRMPGGQEYSIK